VIDLKKKMNRKPKRKQARTNFSKRKQHKISVEGIENRILDEWFTAPTLPQLQFLLSEKGVPKQEWEALRKLECVKKVRDWYIQNCIDLPETLALNRVEDQDKNNPFLRCGTQLTLCIASFMSIKEVACLANTCLFLARRLSLNVKGVPSLYLTRHCQRLILYDMNVQQMTNLLARTCALQSLRLWSSFPHGPCPFALFETHLQDITVSRYTVPFCEVISALENCKNLRRLSIFGEYACPDDHPLHREYIRTTPPFFPHVEFLNLERPQPFGCCYYDFFHEHTPHVKHFNAVGIAYLHPLSFPRLTYLNLFDCHAVKGQSTSVKLHDFKELKTVLLSPTLSSQVVNLPSSLHTLVLMVDFFRYTRAGFVLQNCSQLQEIYITSSHSDGNYQGEIAMMFTTLSTNCRKLQVLHLQILNDLDGLSMDWALDRLCVLSLLNGFEEMKTIKLTSNMIRVGDGEQMGQTLVKKYRHRFKQAKFRVALQIALFECSDIRGLRPLLNPCN
jgi:hypothetical protein